MLDAIKNFGKVGVSAGYASGVTSIALAASEGARLPDPSTDGEFNLTWYDSTNYPDPADDPLREIVRCTARTGDNLTIVRNQEGTGDNNHNTGAATYKMILSLTKKTMDDIDETLSAVDFIANQVAHALSALKAVYYDTGSNLWVYAQADDVATPGTHMIVEVIDVDNIKLSAIGRHVVTAHGFTPGEYYFVSDSVAGDLTTTEPTISNPMIYIESADAFHILSYRPSTPISNTYWNRALGVLNPTTKGDIVKIRRTAIAYVIDAIVDLATGDGQFYFTIPQELDGMNLIALHARVITAGTTGTSDFQFHNVTAGFDMLTTELTIDSGETGSDTAAVPYVIDAAHDDVAINTLIRVDIDAVSTTPPKGLIVRMEFRLP